VIAVAAAALAVIAAVLGYWLVAAVVLAAGGTVVLFFRDPQRRVPDDKRLLLAPADGKVTEISQVEREELGGKALKIGIFLSIFDVHINRSPCSARVLKIAHRAGRCLNAMKLASSEQNTCTELLLEPTVEGLPGRVVVRQITGAIARRIVCACREGDVLQAGQRFGMIKFGSRTELIVPLRPEGRLAVKLGQKVKAGQDVLVTYQADGKDNRG